MRRTLLIVCVAVLSMLFIPEVQSQRREPIDFSIELTPSGYKVHVAETANVAVWFDNATVNQIGYNFKDKVKEVTVTFDKVAPCAKIRVFVYTTHPNIWNKESRLYCMILPIANH